MTVRELIRELQRLSFAEHSERLVVVARDAEGNAFMPLSYIELGAFAIGEGRAGIEALTPELIDEGYSEQDVVQGEPCIILWPGS